MIYSGDHHVGPGDPADQELGHQGWFALMVDVFAEFGSRARVATWQLDVKRVEEEEKTKGGIIIPDTAKEKPQEGEVIATGPGARDDSGKVQPLDVKVGDIARISVDAYPDRPFQGTVEKVEPPNWWAGSSVNPVRLLIRGKNLGGSRVQAVGRGVRIAVLSFGGRLHYVEAGNRLGAAYDTFGDHAAAVKDFEKAYAAEPKVVRTPAVRTLVLTGFAVTNPQQYVRHLVGHHVHVHQPDHLDHDQLVASGHARRPPRRPACRTPDRPRSPALPRGSAAAGRAHRCHRRSS